ncbi:MAG: 3-phenylpropionate/cinnamic acid dioxygenase subunit beta [Pseudomonadota bacterium]
MARASAQEIALLYELERFLYHEAELIDERRFEEWLQLFAEDLIYFMPIRRNVKFGEHATAENTRQGADISWFDEDKWTLSKRVEQINTGLHYAEEPLSRTCHMVSNVELISASPDLTTPSEVVIKSRFLVYQNRVETETYTFVGKRIDHLRASGDSWQVFRREVVLDQNVLLAKNLSTFF